jgi:predicted nucleotidyltransferase
MDFGLRQQDLKEIVAILQKFSAVEEAIIFGSRAKGTYRKGSDIDIAVKGREIDQGVIAALSDQLNEESATPYFFDVVHFEEISEQELIEHINRVGQSIYSSEGAA